MKPVLRKHSFKYSSWEELKKTEPKIKIIFGADAIKDPPVIIMGLEAFQIIKTFVDLCPDEISGLGMVDRVDNEFTITEPFILEQATARGGLHVTLDPMELNHFIGDMVRKNQDPGRVKFQWHSHVNAGAFFSGEDTDTVANYLCDWMISMVLNKQGDYKCRLDVFKPFYIGFETRLFIRIPRPDKRVIKTCQREIDEKVSSSFFSKVGTKLSKKLHLPPTASEFIVPAEELLLLKPEEE